MHEGWKLGKKRFRELPERVQPSLLAVSNAIDDRQGTETLCWINGITEEQWGQGLHWK